MFAYSFYACMWFLVSFVFGSDAGNLVRALTKFSHLTADTIISGSATAHMAHTDNADRKSTHLHMHKPIDCG